MDERTWYQNGMAKKKKKRNIFVRMFSSIPSRIEAFFYWYGGIIADHAAWFVAVPLAIAVVMIPGMLQLQRITNENKIWPLSDSLSINEAPTKERFDSYDSICTPKERLGENGPYVSYDERGNENNYIDRGEIPESCEGAVDSIDMTCPFLQLMMRTKENPKTGERYDIMGRSFNLIGLQFTSLNNRRRGFSRNRGLGYGSNFWFPYHQQCKTSLFHEQRFRVANLWQIRRWQVYSILSSDCE